jgi:predicted RNase H-like HicB family nuclease
MPYLCYTIFMDIYPPEYLQAALRKAHYEQTEEGEWFASIPGFDGLWAVGPSVEEAREQLLETLLDWIQIHVSIGKNRLPDVDGMNLYDLPKTVEHD